MEGIDRDEPTPKRRKIYLQKDISEAEFHVIKLVNSIRYKPGQLLSEDQVEELCEDEEWEVTVEKFKGGPRLAT